MSLVKTRQKECVACGHPPPSEAHHILKRSLGGHNGPLLSLCANCHTQAEYAWHRNLKKFFDRFPHLLNEIRLKGYDYDGRRIVKYREEHTGPGDKDTK